MKTVLAFLAFLILAAAPAAADKVTTEKVKFAAGTSGATIKGAIKSRDTMHYVLGASAGQNMRVKLSTNSTSTYFNVSAPGKMPGNDEALFIGDIGGDTFEGVLPASGDYLIQAYLHRAAARRGEQADFTLDIGIDAASSGGSNETGDAKVAGTDFNATRQINCARGAGQPMGACEFGVVRRENGGADLTVFWPDGGNRVIFFENGQPVGYDQSEADGGAELGFTRNADLFVITIGEQRFEFPEAVNFGG